MSWPADGLPRYVAGSERQTPPVQGIDWRSTGYVADRGYCHRRVWEVRHKVVGVALRDAERAAAIMNSGGTP